MCYLEMHLWILLAFADLKKVSASCGLKKKECQVEKNKHFRHILLFEFNRGVKAADATENICAVYGENSIVEHTARQWFSHFKKGLFDLNDSPERPAVVNKDPNEPHHLTWEQ